MSQCGPVAKGSLAWTFTLTDIATGWTECAPLLAREQTVLVAVLSAITGKRYEHPTVLNRRRDAFRISRF